MRHVVQEQIEKGLNGQGDRGRSLRSLQVRDLRVNKSRSSTFTLYMTGWRSKSPCRAEASAQVLQSVELMAEHSIMHAGVVKCQSAVLRLAVSIGLYI